MKISYTKDPASFFKYQDKKLLMRLSMDISIFDCRLVFELTNPENNWMRRCNPLDYKFFTEAWVFPEIKELNEPFEYHVDNFK